MTLSSTSGEDLGGLHTYSVRYNDNFSALFLHSFRKNSKNPGFYATLWNQCCKNSSSMITIELCRINLYVIMFKRKGL